MRSKTATVSEDSRAARIDPTCKLKFFDFMAFLHRTRLFVNDLLSPFGFAINRAEKQPWKCFRTTQAVVSIQFGRYSIQVPKESQFSVPVRPSSATFGAARQFDLVGKKEVFIPRSG